MAELTSRDAIVVLKASVTHDDPGEIVGSNVWFVNALLEEHLTADEIAQDALVRRRRDRPGAHPDASADGAGRRRLSGKALKISRPALALRRPAPVSPPECYPKTR